MAGILIESPRANPDSGLYASYSHGDQDLLDCLSDLTRTKHITPETHPHVLDLCSGDGSMAVMLNKLGWKPEAITCVDQYLTKEPLLKDTKWVYMDLELLAGKLTYGSALPETNIDRKIKDMKHKFEVVICMSCGVLRARTERILIEFFKTPDGFSFS